MTAKATFCLVHNVDVKHLNDYSVYRVNACQHCTLRLTGNDKLYFQYLCSNKSYCFYTNIIFPKYSNIIPFSQKDLYAEFRIHTAFEF